MSDTPKHRKDDQDTAGELADDNDLMADLEFEQMLTEASKHRPTGGPWLDKPRPIED
jgi:hypothetical protein